MTCTTSLWRPMAMATPMHGERRQHMECSNLLLLLLLLLLRHLRPYILIHYQRRNPAVQDGPRRLLFRRTTIVRQEQTISYIMRIRSRSHSLTHLPLLLHLPPRPLKTASLTRKSHHLCSPHPRRQHNRALYSLQPTPILLLQRSVRILPTLDQLLFRRHQTCPRSQSLLRTPYPQCITHRCRLTSPRCIIRRS